MTLHPYYRLNFLTGGQFKPKSKAENHKITFYMHLFSQLLSLLMLKTS